MKSKAVLIVGGCFMVLANLANSADVPPLPHSKVNIVVSGSSTVWGEGLLDDGLVGPIDDYIKHILSTTVMSSEMTYTCSATNITPKEFLSPKLYKGIGHTITGVGSAVEFELSGDELAICQVIQRTSSWGKLGVFADGKRIATLVNKNHTLGQGQMSFVGDGKRRLLELGRPFTYNHKVTINGKVLTGKIHTGRYMRQAAFEKYSDCDYIVVRKNNPTLHAVHAVLLKTAPEEGATLAVSFDYGALVAHTDCTVGETDDCKTIESSYGIGGIQHDPAHPSNIATGLDFRTINRESFFIHRFTKNATRKIKLVIEGGENPYFTINFACNRYHNLMNAGIGGFRADLFLNDMKGRSYREAVTPFLPDVYFIALGGNDDWREPKRFVSRTLENVSRTELKQFPTLELHSVKKNTNDTYIVVKNTGIIDAVTPTSLNSRHLIGTKVEPGHFIRIGNYSGDNNSVAVRVISAVDTETGRVEWSRPLGAAEILCLRKLDDLVGAEFSVRSLAGYGRNMDELVRALKAVNPVMQIIFLNVYNTDYFTREIWGYPELQRIIAGRYQGVHTINAAQALQEFQMSHISGKDSFEIEANGASEYILPWKSHWQGFRVWVDDVNVYGRDCIVKTGMYYGVVESEDGSIVEYEKDYFRPKKSIVFTNMKLEFLRNAPSGGTIRVEKADTVWSGDYAHPGSAGIHVIGRECTSKLREILGE